MLENENQNNLSLNNIINNNNDNNNNNQNNNILSSINSASDNPMVLNLIEFGFNPLYSQRLFNYYHPRNIEDALDYLSFENGIIQHHFVQDRNDIENNNCYLCGEPKDIHLINLQINNNNIEDIKESINKKEKSFINSSISELPEQKECPTCNEFFISTDKNTLICGHSFCDECWYDFLSIKIKENKLTLIKCLDYECPIKPSDNFIINLLNSDDKLIERYKKFKLELDIINDPNKKLCPFPNCNSFLEKKDNNNYVKCLNNHIFCFLCLDKPHGNSPCKKLINDSLNEYAKINFIKKCPNCNIITEKITGCNHITCTKCNYQWCWLCNGEYNPEHFNEGKCRGYQFFRPKDENEIKLAFEGKIQLRESQQQEDLSIERDSNHDSNINDNNFRNNNSFI